MGCLKILVLELGSPAGQSGLLSPNLPDLTYLDVSRVEVAVFGSRGGEHLGKRKLIVGGAVALQPYLPG